MVYSAHHKSLNNWVKRNNLERVERSDKLGGACIVKWGQAEENQRKISTFRVIETHTNI